MSGAWITKSWWSLSASPARSSHLSFMKPLTSPVYTWQGFQAKAQVQGLDAGGMRLLEFFRQVLTDGEQHLSQDLCSKVAIAALLSDWVLEAATSTWTASHWVAGPGISPRGSILEILGQNLDVADAVEGNAQVFRLLGEEVQLGVASSSKMHTEENLRSGRAFKQQVQHCRLS